MEIKKDPKVNLETRKDTYWLTGLTGILAVLFIAFEWTDVAKHTSYGRFQVEDNWAEEELSMMPIQTPPPPPPPPPMPDIIEEIIVVDDNVETAEFEIQTEVDADTEVEIRSIDITEAPVIEEEDTGVYDFVAIEHEPEFPGGTKAMMEFIGRNLRYPTFEAESGIQGRVVLSFVIEKDGSVTDITEMRSPSEGLTKEAMRMLNSMPKWKPGKQRGKPVRVKYVLPVTFRLT